MKLQIKHYRADADCRTYYTRVLLSDGFEMPDTSEFSKLVLDIRGVQSTYTNRYELTVHKSPSFDWDEIEPQILALVKALAESTEVKQ